MPGVFNGADVALLGVLPPMPPDRPVVVIVPARHVDITDRLGGGSRLPVCSGCARLSSSLDEAGECLACSVGVGVLPAVGGSAAGSTPTPSEPVHGRVRSSVRAEVLGVLRRRFPTADPFDAMTAADELVDLVAERGLG